MNALRTLEACALMLLGAACGSVNAANDPIGAANRLPPSLEQKVQDLTYMLEVGGYEVARGYWTLWTAEDCKLPLQTVGFCYGNNPTAPYVIAVLPHWPDEFVDKSLHHVLLQGQKGMTPNYRLGEREALVVLAELPPPARYFGLGTNVFTRQAELNTADPVYQRLFTEGAGDLLDIIFGFSPNPDRMMMIATIGDTINNVVIEEQSMENWGQQRFFVTTPDEAMADTITDALEGLGVDEKHVFTEPVGIKNPDEPENETPLVRLGYGAGADDFITYMRYSMPNDLTLGEQWREQLPVAVLRVRERNGDEAVKPYPIPEYEGKACPTDEPAELGDDFDKLVEAVKAYWGQEGNNPQREAFRSLTLWVDLVGQHCLGHDGPPATDTEPPPEGGITLPRGPSGCLGDNQDDEPLISSGTFNLDDDQVIAVVGAIGTKTGNATYTSVSVNWFPELVGVLNRDDTVLEESAKKFKEALTPPELYTKFYVYYFARDCTGLYPWCQEVPRSLVPKGDTIKILQRNYVAPGSRRGPDPSCVLDPVAIEFDGSEGKRPEM